jgi:hypothetical protein
VLLGVWVQVDDPGLPILGSTQGADGHLARLQIHVRPSDAQGLPFPASTELKESEVVDELDRILGDPGGVAAQEIDLGHGHQLSRAVLDPEALKPVHGQAGQVTVHLRRPKHVAKDGQAQIARSWHEPLGAQLQEAGVEVVRPDLVDPDCSKLSRQKVRYPFSVPMVFVVFPECPSRSM